MYDKIFLQGGGKLLVVLSWDTISNNDASTLNCDEDGKDQHQTSTLQPSQISHYEILFNGVGVPTTEIHPGVLRCLIPGNKKCLLDNTNKIILIL